MEGSEIYDSIKRHKTRAVGIFKELSDIGTMAKWLTVVKKSRCSDVK